MDEHTILTEGHAIELKHFFFDENLNGIEPWIKKHLDYANREVITYHTASDTSVSEMENDLYSKTGASFLNLSNFSIISSGKLQIVSFEKSICFIGEIMFNLAGILKSLILFYTK